jgi:hypothetical protein
MNPHRFAEACGFSARRELAIAANDVRGVQEPVSSNNYNNANVAKIPAPVPLRPDLPLRRSSEIVQSQNHRSS